MEALYFIIGFILGAVLTWVATNWVIDRKDAIDFFVDLGDAPSEDEDAPTEPPTET